MGSIHFASQPRCSLPPRRIVQCTCMRYFLIRCTSALVADRCRPIARSRLTTGNVLGKEFSRLVLFARVSVPTRWGGKRMHHARVTSLSVRHRRKRILRRVRENAGRRDRPETRTRVFHSTKNVKRQVKIESGRIRCTSAGCAPRRYEHNA